MDIRQEFDKLRELDKFRVSYGSVQGRLRVAGDTGDAAKSRRYKVVESFTDRDIECVIPEHLAQEASDALGRRVVLSGKVYHDQDGEKARVEEVEDILVMPEEHELPTLDELQGSMPNLTGGRSVEEHLRILRSEGYDDYP